MEEKELRDFIKNNEENITLEYKLKPNFNEIKEGIDAIKKRMHFKILRTIYAFANTEGGDIYIGIKDKKRTIEGVDDCDIKLVEKQILSKMDRIIKIEKEHFKLKNNRVVIKIKVNKLNLWDKPVFFRRNFIH